MKRWLPIAVLVLAVGAFLLWLRVQTSLPSAIVRGGAGPPNIVLLHGYGSNAEDWLQFSETVNLPPNGRFVFPNGPWRGPSGARGWWWLNIEGHVPKGERFPDFSVASPAGIKVASRLVREFLEDVPEPIVLGGFSQGAMLSGEIAFQSEQPLAALVMLGGTTVNEAVWVERFPGRRSLPIFIAHGRQDGVLPFAIADRFRTKLQAAGLDVTWVPFDGGHEIPPPVIRELNTFLAKHVSR
ncbi:MAG: alpha/beta fold hydrolase [Acidobacteriota bacterium]|nr:alpha/beta fold hydrolase [Acidobacteriota bacterium]